MRTQYRVAWKREGWEKAKRKGVASLAAAERLIGLLTSDEPWRFLRDFRDKGPDDYFCCPGGTYYECSCGGTTVREWCEEKRKDLPPVVKVWIESRQVGPYAPIPETRNGVWNDSK